MSFFEKLLPAKGLKCVALALPGGGFKHYFYEDTEEAVEQAKALDGQGETVFMAQSSFNTTESRKQVNALNVKNFFLDIDCGKGKPYASQKAGIEALSSFCDESKIPLPSIVNSGNGLYAHWILTHEISAEQWITVARTFKQLLTAYNFHADPARTSDSASVLRPIGSHNRKGKPKPVSLMFEAEMISFEDFSLSLVKAARGKDVNLEAIKPPKTAPLNADFMVVQSGPRPSASVIADKCNQIKIVRDKADEVDEPLWYHAIGLLSFCEETEADADDLIQDWSSGHPDYTEDATSNKIDQFRSTGVGPTTCKTFGETNATGCIGCPHKGEIKSPIVLGREKPEEIKDDDPEVLDAPPGYMRAEDGLYCERDGQWEKFYDCDVVPVRLSYDASLEYEVCTVKHQLPHHGYMEFTFRSSLVHDTRAFISCIMDNHIKLVGPRSKAMMVGYMESYLHKLQRQREMSRLLCQMGWRDDLFVLGKKIFHPDGRIDDAALARNVPQAALAFHQKGDPDIWKEKTKLLDEKGMEPFAFALLCGFAAPLMKFTGFDGALVCMTGSTGVGKTLMLRWAQSIYGFHNDLMMLREDTKNALIHRLGIYNTLPLTIDEITNIDGIDLSDLVYRVTQGRDKARLTKNSVEKASLNTWNTLALVSTNSSLVDKLGNLKHDANAEINRVFEYETVLHKKFQAQTTTDVYWALHENYGHAGEKYIHWLVQHQREIKPALDAVRQKIDEEAHISGEERFWSAVASTAIYGGTVAKLLGLIDFDVQRVMNWAIKTIKYMRGERDDLTSSAADILGQFIDEHSHNMLIVKSDNGPNKPCIPVLTPRGPLYMRHEQSTHKLYISRKELRTWIDKGYGSYRWIMSQLKEGGALKDANFRKVLGAGTPYGGAQQPCWYIDLKSPVLGHVGLTLVQEADALAEKKEGVA